MAKRTHLLFVHGLEGSSQGVKASLLGGLFPGILTPDFSGSLDERMRSLREILGDSIGWKIIGSSFGGLMAALFACQQPKQVKRLVLLAPALVWPDFASHPQGPVDMPVVVIHGRQDALLPLSLVREQAERAFTNLDFRIVDDDHGLYQTVHALDWRQVLGEE